ncbi:ATP-binding cassette domain-containing protein, partial [Enterocloster asparagiformis]
MAKQALLHFKNVKKSFSGNVVLSGVDFEIFPGQIVALAGENGAGKSTLMNILFGMNVIQETGGYEGEIIFEGKPVKIQSPEDAMALGIGMVH